MGTRIRLPHSCVPLGAQVAERKQNPGLWKFILQETCFHRHLKLPFISVASVVSSCHHDNPPRPMRKKKNS